jgi:spermidine/putrescine transport system substrate-binding protein
MPQKMSQKILISALVLILAGCTGKKESANQLSNSIKPRTVSLFIWSNYLTPETVQEFEKKTGIHIQISNFSSNEELLAKLQAGANGYDVIVPSDYMIAVMVKLGLLKNLEMQKIPNSVNLDGFVLKKQFDPQNQFSLPYAWAMTGIAVNRDLYKGEIKSWKDLLQNPALAGKLSLLDDVREVIGATLKMNGVSLNSVNKADLDKAKSVLMSARKSVRSFNSEPMSALVNGEITAAQIYSSDAQQAVKQSGGKIAFYIPEEGSTFYIDNLAIPKSATHIEEAHELINFLLQTKANANLVRQRFTGPVVKGTTALLPKDLQKNPGIFPSAKVLAKSEMVQDLGESTALYDRIWTEVKAAQ